MSEPAPAISSNICHRIKWCKLRHPMQLRGESADVATRKINQVGHINHNSDNRPGCFRCLTYRGGVAKTFDSYCIGAAHTCHPRCPTSHLHCTYKDLLDGEYCFRPRCSWEQCDFIHGPSISDDDQRVVVRSPAFTAEILAVLGQCLRTSPEWGVAYSMEDIEKIVGMIDPNLDPNHLYAIAENACVDENLPTFDGPAQKYKGSPFMDIFNGQVYFSSVCESCTQPLVFFFPSSVC